MNAQRRYDPYRVLGVPRHASQEAIKRAYREQAKRTHPDRDPSAHAASRFMALQQAYETLRDPLPRLACDQRLRALEHPKPAPRPRPMTAPGPVDDGRVSWAFVGLHLTGLVFGVLLILGILTGITFNGWPWPSIFFCIPGIIVIPDAWDGVRLPMKKAPRR